MVHDIIDELVDLQTWVSVVDVHVQGRSWDDLGGGRQREKGCRS